MTSPTPFLPVAAPVIGEREIEYVTDAVRSGWVSSMGPYIDRFERGFADLCGTRHAIAVANGTVALHLAVHALGVGQGDEVIVPDLTFAATAHTVLQTGATPVFADVEEDTWNLDPRAVERAITRQTKAIIAVHLYGHPADMDALADIAKRHSLLLIEDAAEAHGAKLGSRTVGSLGRVGAFSFYGNKIITTGEGGMLTTDDDALAGRLRFLKDHGMSKERRYHHTELAFNYRMTNLQAALGAAQIERAEELIEKKRSIMDGYRKELANVSGLKLAVERTGAKNVYWMASAVLDESIQPSREEVMDRMRRAGVDSRPFFVPMSELPHLAHFPRRGRNDERACPVSARLGRRGLNLPSGAGMTADDVSRAAAALIAALQRPAAG